MQSIFVRFLVRWIVSSTGLWLAAALLSSRISYGDTASGVIVAGLILALLNMLIKPVLVLFTLPAVILTLGLFMLVINGLVVLLASALYPPLHIHGFWAAVFAGLMIGLVNYLVTRLLEDHHDRA